MLRRGFPGERRELVGERLVRIAIRPGFAGLERANHRVLRLVEVLGRVTIRRVVAAPDVAAGEA
jgi:hypothetical protein